MPKILVADDSRMIREVFGFVLRNHDYDVQEAADGSEAIQLVARQKFDLIITDLNMPQADGIEVITSVRSSATNSHTPVYVVSTEAGADKKSAAKKAGANGWIGKPVTEGRILKAVQNAVG